MVCLLIGIFIHPLGGRHPRKFGFRFVLVRFGLNDA